MAKDKVKVDILALDESGAYIHSSEQMREYIEESNKRILRKQKEIEKLNDECAEEARKQHKVDVVLNSLETEEVLVQREYERLQAFQKSQEEDAKKNSEKIEKLKELSESL